MKPVMPFKKSLSSTLSCKKLKVVMNPSKDIAPWQLWKNKLNFLIETIKRCDELLF